MMLVDLTSDDLLEAAAQCEQRVTALELAFDLVSSSQLHKWRRSSTATRAG
jgi:transposase-like protein